MSGGPVLELENVSQYYFAAARKILMASFHRDALQIALDNAPADEDGRPPIAVQAHFEGVLYAFTAASDQIGEALRPPEVTGNGDIFRRVAEALEESNVPPEYAADLMSWCCDDIFRKVKRARNRATHHHYDKVERVEVWIVAGENQTTLIAMADEAVGHLARLRAVLPRLPHERIVVRSSARRADRRRG